MLYVPEDWLQKAPAYVDAYAIPDCIPEMEKVHDTVCVMVDTLAIYKQLILPMIGML